MITLDFRDQGVLVTGGTRGLGKAIAIEAARTGATVFVTHRWGSVDEADLTAEFVALGLAAPVIVECDASDRDATRDLIRTISARVPVLRAVISNVAFSKVVGELTDLKKSSLDLSASYSSWPIVDLALACEEVLGSFPRYLIAISGDGGEVCYEGYDLAGTSKAILETLCRYLAVRLKPRGVRVNAVRPGAIDTQSMTATFGDERVAEMRARFGEFVLDPARVARSCVALFSGMMDAVTGQVLTVDEGWSLFNPIGYLLRGGAPFRFPDDEGA